LIVPASGQIYVDANTVVYHVERSEPYCSIDRLSGRAGMSVADSTMKPLLGGMEARAGSPRG
jgi:hypothetical protein